MLAHHRRARRLRAHPVLPIHRRQMGHQQTRCPPRPVQRPRMAPSRPRTRRITWPARVPPQRLPVTCAPWHHLPVDSDWDRFISQCQQALGDLVEGRPGPFKALWSHADDVVIMGAFGGYERGWDQVSARLDWAASGIKATDRAAENIVTVVGDNLAYTVDLEHRPVTPVISRSPGPCAAPRPM